MSQTPNRIFHNLVLLSLSALLLGCGESHQNDAPYILPSEIYEFPDYDQAILHPASVIDNLSYFPQNECEREDLRRYIISLNMFSVDVHNQTYLIEANSTGYQLLLSAFPTLNDTQDGDEEMISIENISNHLRGIRTDCETYSDTRYFKNSRQAKN